MDAGPVAGVGADVDVEFDGAEGGCDGFFGALVVGGGWVIYRGTCVGEKGLRTYGSQ